MQMLVVQTHRGNVSQASDRQASQILGLLQPESSASERRDDVLRDGEHKD